MADTDTSKDRFTWKDGDVILKDGTGKELTRREVLEQQYAELAAREETDKNIDALVGADDESE